MTLLEFLQAYDVHQLLDCFVSDGIRRLRVHPDAIAATERLLAVEPQARPETFPLYGYAHSGSLMLTTFRMSFEVIGVPAAKGKEIDAASSLVPNEGNGGVLAAESKDTYAAGVAESPDLESENQLPAVASQLTLL